MHPLHPRSNTTRTLFSATLAVSFLVVGIPHLLPCPVDRRQFADSADYTDGTGPRRRRRIKTDMTDAVPRTAAAMETEANMKDYEDGRPKRECPVPKPGGRFGQFMGFKAEEKSQPAEVIVQPVESRRARQPTKESDSGV